MFPGHPESWTPLQIPSWGPPLGCTLLHRGHSGVSVTSSLNGITMLTLSTFQEYYEDKLLMWKYFEKPKYYQCIQGNSTRTMAANSAWRTGSLEHTLQVKGLCLRLGCLGEKLGSTKCYLYDLGQVTSLSLHLPCLGIIIVPALMVVAKFEWGKVLKC